MLQPHISYQFKSPVWRLEIDALSETIFAEIREPADKKVYFAGINLNSGKVFFDELQTEERWFTGIEAAYDGILLLHNYESDAGPAHKGLMAIDGTTGETIWSNYIYAFDHLSAYGAVIYDMRIQPRKLLLADTRTGIVKRQYEPSIDTELDNHLVLPEVVPWEFLQSTIASVSPFGNTAHYLEHNNFRIVSLHTFAGEALQQHLYIMDSTEIIYEDLLNTDIQKLQPESFLMHKDHLIYLKDKSQLKVLNL
ncbi:MAG: hypothetical protein JWR54_2188 [Mucilaginibacter sp.]|nr:hypothetical protein [Mucilaginibacter sp.]